MRVLPLTFFSLLVPVVSGAFPYYDIIHLNLVALYSYFNPEKPILTNVAFWGSFVESSASTVEKATNICSACESDKKEPNWDCHKASLDLAKSICLNAISLYIGWQHTGRPNKALKGANPTAVKKEMLQDTAKLKIRLTKTILLLGFLTGVLAILLMLGMKYPIQDLTKEILNYIIYS